jgi:HSP20 family molecular chaperone IbpA
MSGTLRKRIMKMKSLIFIMTILVSANLFAQTSQLNQDEQFQKQFEEIMKAREEMFNSLMDDSAFGDMEKHMLDMMKQFGGANSKMGFGMEDLEGPVVGEYDWTDTETYKILKIKVKQIKDRPLDIKIEKGMINIKGDVETAEGTGKNKLVKKVHFERAFSIPADVDQTSPEFENKEGFMLIKFKRLAGAKNSQHTAAPKTVPKDSLPKQEIKPERQPIAPDSSDLSI